MITRRPGVPLPKPGNASAYAPKSERGFDQKWWVGADVDCKICQAGHTLEQSDLVFCVRAWYDDERGVRGIGQFRCPCCCVTVYFETQLTSDGEGILPGAPIMPM